MSCPQTKIFLIIQTILNGMFCSTFPCLLLGIITFITTIKTLGLIAGSLRLQTYDFVLGRQARRPTLAPTATQTIWESQLWQTKWHVFMG